MNLPPGLLVIADWLDNHPEIPYTSEGGVLAILANGPGGFEILVNPGTAGFDVLCHGWRMYEGVSHDQIYQLVCWLVSNKCRLEVEYTAGMATRYTLQTFDGSKWLDSKEVKKTNLGFWKEKSTVVLTNGYV